ncbi:hypothetical protein SB5439_04985 [Klebsiella variicola]|uniref:phage tail assembly chaperone n=1 Tax=Klebsiella variicola TaxID=244366 RepID=UPI00109C9A18|nr:phage tail assembly chaperone [Klebsiella variicola]VGQ11704.1 hypothetical protein SB5439_04985 [Klebsiella variicola]
MTIRDLALAPKSGFRSKVINVPEWDNAVVTIREPSAQAWLQWQEIVYPNGEENDEELNAVEKAHRNLKADVMLFINILFDGDERVFNDEDAAQVQEVYGPIHARIVKQALNLSLTSDEAVKK